MRVALVMCPSWDQDFPSFPIALLCAQLRGRGHEVSFFDLNKDFYLYNSGVQAAPVASADLLWLDHDFVENKVFQAFRPYFEAYARRVLESAPVAVGFTVYDNNAVMCLLMARLLRAREPGVRVVFGGAHCFDLEAARKLAAEPGADLVVVGEGEETLPALLEALERGRAPEGLPGVLTRESLGVPTPPVLPPPADMDRSPTPCFDVFNLADYPMRSLPLETTRGCVRRCVFCDDWRRWTKFRQKKAERTVGQMLELLRGNPETRSFLFADSIINGDMRQLGALAEGLSAAGFDRKWFGHAIVRPEMTPAALEGLRAAGCERLMYGVETGSDKVSRDMGKNVSAGLNARVVRDTRCAGIRTLVYLMTGFPTETEGDFEASLAFVRDNAEAIDTLHVTPCAVQEMRDRAGRFGILPFPDNDQYWMSQGGANNFMVRVERFRRAVHLGLDLGLSVNYYRRTDRSNVDAYCETLKEQYSRYLFSHMPLARQAAAA